MRADAFLLLVDALCLPPAVRRQLKPDRVAEIAKWLNAHARGLAAPATDRAFWGPQAKPRENVARRVAEPYLAMVRGQRLHNWWLDGANNWTAVCQSVDDRTSRL